MNTSDGFSTGPRFSDVPQGDIARQAVASLRGYAFQLYGSVLAWIELKDDEDLFLEIAEDYAVVAKGAINAVQAKETRAFGAVTLNSADVRKSIDSFVDLLHRNPARTVSLRYSTTSPIGVEKEVGDRIEGIPGLDYWKLVARGEDIAPLRARLLRLDLKPETQAYIEGLDDEGLRDNLIRRIIWDCGQGGIEALEAEIGAKLLRNSLPRLRIDPDQVQRVTSALFEQVLQTAISTTSQRRLSTVQLYISIRSVTHTQIQTSDLNALISLAIGQGRGTHQLAEIPASPWMVTLSDLPPIARLVPRQTLVDTVQATLGSSDLVILTGSTGVGKSTIARLAAAEVGGNWRLVDLRDLTGGTTSDRLTAMLAWISDIETGGLILEDLDSWGDNSVRRSLLQLVAAIRRRNLRCLISSHTAPSLSIIADIGASPSVIVPVPYFSIEEISELTTKFGQEGELWSPIVHAMSGGGHPQLVQASISVLEAKGWPQEEFANLIIGTPELEQERALARRRLIEALPDEGRQLLYRLSIVVGQMDRGLSSALAQVEPVIERPGEALQRLIGPWIEQFAGNQLRVSPLVMNAGLEMLGPGEIQSVRHEIVGFLMRAGKINVGDLDSILIHALAGKVEWALTAVGTSVVRAKENILTILADHFVTLPMLKTDVPIYPENLSVSTILRLAQFELLKVMSKPDNFTLCVRALVSETENKADNFANRHMRLIVLAKVLIVKQTAAAIPKWIDLLLEYRELVARWQEKSRGSGHSVPSELFESFAGLLFVVQCLGVQEVRVLSYVFDRLDSLDENTRGSIIRAIEAVPGAMSSIMINGSWLAEVQRGTLVWDDAAVRFDRMARQAAEWGRRELALRCHTVRGVMADEYGKEPEAALAMLDEAEALLGPDPILAQARAKILWRKNNYADALPLLEHAELKAGGAVERIFLLREGAICAGEVGDWVRAQAWFWRGHITADTELPEVLEALSIGLAADAAVANIHLNCYRDALTQLVECVERLSGIDSELSLQNAYVHGIVRHTLLWVQMKIIGDIKAISTDEPIVMVAGACSNPEPHESIRSRPLEPLEIAWYILARCEVALGGDAAIARTLDVRLGERTIPALEAQLRFHMVGAAIKAGDTESFVKAVVKWLDAAAFLNVHLTENVESEHSSFQFGRIPCLMRAERSNSLPSGVALAAIRALAVYCNVLERPLPVAELIAGFQPHIGVDHSAITLLSYLAKPVPIIDVMSSPADVLSYLDSGAPRHPEDSLIVSVHLLELTSQSDYRRVLEQSVATWIAAEWQKVATTQQFALASPRINNPAILAAVARSKNNLASGADIVLSACPRSK